MTSSPRVLRTLGFTCMVLLLALPPLGAQVSSSSVTQLPTGGRYSLLSLSASPFLSVPVGANALVFGVGGGSGLSVTYRLPPFPMVYAVGALDYGFVSSLAPGTSLSALGLGAGAGVRLPLLPFLSANIFGTGGYFLAFLNGPGAPAEGNPFLSGGVRFDFDIADSWGIGAGGAYRYFAGLFSDVAVTVAATYHVPAIAAAGRGAALPAGFTPLKNDGRGLRVIGLKADPIFPVFSKHYDDHPLAEVALRNFEGVPADKVKMTAIMKGYMDGARECAVQAKVEPGKDAAAMVFGLFNDRLLEVAERTKLSLTLVVEYSQYGKTFRDEYAPSVDVLYRNAMTWEDDRRMAAFISSRDPAANGFARGVLAAAREARNRALSQDLQSAMLIFNALREFGLTYVKDPVSALATGDRNAVDSLQFPQETLNSRSGDCDDLSILFCSLLESVGIETAFITTPGHVFAAFLLDVRPEDVVKAYGKSEDFIVRGGKTWVPVEVTALSSDFLSSWKQGAREWLAAKDAAAIYPVRDAWASFAPVVVSGAAKAPALPSSAKLTGSLKAEVQGLIARELSPRAEALLAEAKKQGASAKTLNALGVLYARYGQYEKATEQFTKAAAKGDYTPAMVNLGNTYLAQKQYKQASDQFRKILKTKPDDAFSLAGVAMASDGLGNRAEAGNAYGRLKLVDPALAERLSYLDPTGVDAGSRAASAEATEAKIAWQD